jgi:hypothetical protein
MTDREKLIELIRSGRQRAENICNENDDCQSCIITDPNGNCKYGCIADKLIANGVTFAKDNNVPSKWISVKDRLPEKCEPVLVCFDFMGGKAVKASDRYGKNGLLWSGIPCGGKVTHWMELPEPPKGE